MKMMVKWLRYWDDENMCICICVSLCCVVLHCACMCVHDVFGSLHLSVNHLLFLAYINIFACLVLCGNGAVAKTFFPFRIWLTETFNIIYERPWHFYVLYSNQYQQPPPHTTIHRLNLGLNIFWYSYIHHDK